MVLVVRNWYYRTFQLRVTAYCVKSVRIRSYSGPSAGKGEPE